MKFCKKCNQNKPFDAFGKDKKRKYGLTTACKECRNKNTYNWNKNNPEKVKQANLSYKQKRKEYYADPNRMLKYRNADIKRRFGLTHDQYEEMLDSQKGVCAICKKFRLNKGKKFMAIDHCHKSGKVRGVLCHLCNRGLGLFDDNRELLISAIEYLAKE